MTPVTAVLSVAPDAAGGYRVALAVSGLEGAEEPVTEPLGDELTAIADHNHHPAVARLLAVLDRRAAAATREAVGRQLFTGLLRGEVAVTWAKLEQAARARPVRVRLDVGPRRLRALPWELLRSSDGWVVLHGDLGLYRGAAPVGTAGEDRGPLRVLVVVCNPHDRQIMGDDELSRVGGALADGLARTHVEVLDGPSRKILNEEIARLEPHVLHFIGHGMPRVPGGATTLAFNWVTPGNAPGSPWQLRSDDVRSLLSPWVPRLVIVNACRTAADPVDVGGGLLHTFIDAGVRAVVSMQADVESPVATQFAAVLYEQLGRGVPIDRIVAAARQRIRADRGETGEWAMPVLACGTDPGEVLRITFDRPSASIKQLCDRSEYAQLRLFLDRSCERRQAWWAFDPPPAVPRSSSLLVIGGRSTDSVGKTGKTWLTRWCLFTYFLRGFRVTYVDLAKPLQYRDPGTGVERKVVTKDWLDVVRVIRAACVDTHQPEPLPAAAFSAFNAALNSLVRDPLPQPVVAVPGPDVVEDEMRRFDDDRPRAADYRERIVTELRAVLTPAADQPEHVIALTPTTSSARRSTSTSTRT